MLVLTGSNQKILKEAMVRFPGRRGSRSQKDFELHPLSFRDVVQLKDGDLFKRITEKGIEQKSAFQALEKHFLDYLVHGGFMVAINEFVETCSISASTLQTYSDWIRGDILRANKSELYLREIISGVIKRYGSQVSWQALAKDLSINHHQTVSDYIHVLSSSGVVSVLHALQMHTLQAAPKKAKKIYFTDPFIYHALAHWLDNIDDPYQDQILPTLEDSVRCSALVESAVINNYSMQEQVYYIKAEGEVDLAYIKGNSIQLR